MSANSGKLGTQAKTGRGYIQYWDIERWESFPRRGDRSEVGV